MPPSIETIIERLKNQAGRRFTSAVQDAFEYLGFEVEDIEETQGTQAHSDLIVKAPLATNPYFVVLECTAVREGSQVEYQKLYQLGSNFPRYLTKYSKKYPSASYKMLVGRPTFSADCKKLARDTPLMTAELLIQILKAHNEYYLSQDELEGVFQHNGEFTLHEVASLLLGYTMIASIYSLIYLSLLKDPTSDVLERKKEWTNVQGLIAMVKQWGWLFHDIKIPDGVIMDAINQLSSPVLRVLLKEGNNLMLSSLPLERIIQNMRDFGKAFEEWLKEYRDKARKMKESSKE